MVHVSFWIKEKEVGPGLQREVRQFTGRERVNVR